MDREWRGTFDVIKARDWLKKRGFGLVVKGGVYTLLLAHPSTYVKK